MVLISYCTATVVDFSKALLQAAVRVACEQAIHLGWSRVVARSRARAARERSRECVLWRFPSHAINRELAGGLLFGK